MSITSQRFVTRKHILFQGKIVKLAWYPLFFFFFFFQFSNIMHRLKVEWIACDKLCNMLCIILQRTCDMVLNGHYLIILFAMLKLGFLLIISSSPQTTPFSQRFSQVIKTGEVQFNLRMKFCPCQLLFFIYKSNIYAYQNSLFHPIQTKVQGRCR